MLPMLLFLGVVAGLVLRKLTPDERIQLFHKIAATTRGTAMLVKRHATSLPAGCDDFYAALHERTRFAIATPALLVVSLAIYIFMVTASSGLSGDQLLLRWGASVGPRTTNGEWWRLLTAMFVPWGFMHLIANAAGLIQAGRLVERLIGPAAFLCVFLAAGLITGLRELSIHPVAVTTTASAGVFAVYGLLLATSLWGYARRSTLTIPLAALKQIWPGAVVFLIYTLAAEGFFSESMTWGLAVGVAGGGILAFGIGAHKPPVPRLCTSMAVTLALVVFFAAPLRGMADVTREMAEVIDLEQRTAATYDAEVVQFKRGRHTADALADIAEAIAVEVRATHESVSTLTNVPPEHQAMVGDALAYLQLREESWRLRVDGLRAGRMQTLQRAERVESDAKTLFRKVEKLKSGKEEN